MVRGGKATQQKRNSTGTYRSKHKGSDDSDEDYVISCEEDGASNDSDEEYVSSLDGNASEEIFDSFVEEVEEDEEQEDLRKVKRSRPKKSSSVQRKVGCTLFRKRRRVSCSEEEDEDYNGEEEEDMNDDAADDDDDEEYALDEEDYSDEETEQMAKKKKNNAVLRKQRVQNKGPRRRHKRKRRSTVSDKPLKKKRSNCGLRRNARSLKDSDCLDDDRALRVKSKKNQSKRNQRYVIQSDSDFVPSGSSDYDYTISEEEREQVREAEEFCGSLRNNSRSSSFPKKTEEEGNAHLQSKLSIEKGKEKVEGVKPQTVKSVCGICLSEEDKRRVRGTLNCCTHYFCFSCIMQWAKVESRCPLCKQRFQTISKPARSTAGADTRDVVITVPERDQVYQPSEEELRSYLDPYENVICTECHEGGDDGLMLLCDICDSPAHTYCVGLGTEVPEGNWYCEGCRPVALGSSSQTQSRLSDWRTTTNGLSNGPSQMLNSREGLDLNSVASPWMSPIQGLGNLASPRFPTGSVQTTSPVSAAGMPTLSGRRLIHRHIQQLLSSNRMGLLNNRSAAVSASVMSRDLLNSQIDQGRETASLDARNQDVGTPYHTFFQEGLLDHPPASVENGAIISSGSLDASRQGLQSLPLNAFMERHVNWTTSSPLRRQMAQNLSSAFDRSAGNENLLDNIAGINSVTSYDQLRRSRLNEVSATFSNREDGGLHEAKEQLQSMIECHLRSLSRDNDLGQFKDVIGHATHTILAACGLEHLTSEADSIPPPSICSHIELMAGGRMSLMKGCCTSCFDSFVGDVVKKVMSTTAPNWLSLHL